VRVLVVDDHPDLLSALVDLLHARGHVVVACPDAESAWVAFQEGPFPLVLLDISLPGEDGLALCRRLRSNDLGATSIIVVVTGSIDPSNLEQLISAGADDYVPKPYSAKLMDIRLAFAERRAESVIERWRDLTDLKVTDTRFTAFMDHSPAIAVLKDDQGRYVYMNSAFERTFAVHSADAIGRQAADLWPERAAELDANDLLVLANGLPIEAIESVPDLDGSIHHWLVTKFPVRDAGGEVLVGAMAIDISDRYRVERELQTERELLQTMMDNLPDFLYVKDLESRFVRMNIAAALSLGLAEPSEGIGKTDHDFHSVELARQYFDDEQSVIATGIPKLNQLEPLNPEQTLWSLTSTVPIIDADGHVTGIVGISRDVSERRHMEEAIRRSDERQRALLAAMPDMIFRVDRDGIFLDAKNDQRNSLGRPAHELIGKPLGELLAPLPDMLIREAIHRALETGELQIVEIEALMMQLRIEARVVACGSNEVMIIGRNVTEQRILEERLAFQATHDVLTGLPNRLLLSERLEKALAHSRRSGQHVGLLLIDFDDFKSVNDSFGHAVGDRLLVEVGKRLSACTRESDTVARLGGDEFAVLMEDVQIPDEPVALADRIRAHLAQPIYYAGHEIQAPASVGIAIGRLGRVDPVELFRQADVAMYAAKRSGKSRHAVFTQALNLVA
jgi:diguanylate cyclase (GGDEF)-like protein/PAS domain S-box-containing protein